MPGKRKASAKKPQAVKRNDSQEKKELTPIKLEDMTETEREAYHNKILHPPPKKGLVRIWYRKPGGRGVYDDFPKKATVFDLSKKISKNYATHARGKLTIDPKEWQWFYDGEILENTLTLGKIVDRGAPRSGGVYFMCFATNEAVGEVCFCFLLFAMIL